MLLLCDIWVCHALRPQWKFMGLSGYQKKPNWKPCYDKEDGTMASSSFIDFTDETTPNGNWASLRQSSLIQKLWSTYYMLGIVLGPGMVLWIWNWLYLKKMTIRTLGKDKAWATSAQNLHKGRSSERFKGRDGHGAFVDTGRKSLLLTQDWEEVGNAYSYLSKSSW